MIRRNWKEISKLYLENNNCKSDVEFCQVNKIPLGTFNRHKAFLKQKENKIETKAIDIMAKRRAAILEKHLDVGDELINIGMDLVRNGGFTDKDGCLDGFKGALVTEIGSKIHQKVLLDKAEQKGSNIQINIVGTMPRPVVEIKEVS